MKKAYSIRLTAIAVFLLPLVGCYSNSPTSVPTVQNNPTTNQKTLTIAVHDETELSYGTKIFISAEVDSGGAIQLLPAGTQIACDGSSLNYDEASGIYKGAVPSHAIGGSYNFTLTDASGAHFLATVLVRSRPVISSPTKGATVARAKGFTIQYAPDATSVGVASTVRTNSDVFVSSAPETDNGTSAVYDLSTTTPGGGWVQIIRHYQVLHTDLGFSTISANYYTGHVATVNFQ